MQQQYIVMWPVATNLVCLLQFLFRPRAQLLLFISRTTLFIGWTPIKRVSFFCQQWFNEIAFYPSRNAFKFSLYKWKCCRSSSSSCFWTGIDKPPYNLTWLADFPQRCNKPAPAISGWDLDVLSELWKYKIALFWILPKNSVEKKKYIETDVEYDFICYEIILANCFIVITCGCFVILNDMQGTYLEAGIISLLHIYLFIWKAKWDTVITISTIYLFPKWLQELVLGKAEARSKNITQVII